LSSQSEDGGWPIYDGGASDRDLSTLNYFALKLSGYPREHPAMGRAREFILSKGGAGSIHVYYQVFLALFDQFPLACGAIPHMWGLHFRVSSTYATPWFKRRPFSLCSACTSRRRSISDRA
jgi:hypothetical protein